MPKIRRVRCAIAEGREARKAAGDSCTYSFTRLLSPSLYFSRSVQGIDWRQVKERQKAEKKRKARVWLYKE